MTSEKRCLCFECLDCDFTVRKASQIEHLTGIRELNYVRAKQIF